MKILNRIAATACLFGAVLLVSCESPDLSTAHESQVNGLLNVTIQIPDNPTEFYATKKGPYEEGEEITVKVPTTDEDPLDVSRLICTVSVEHNCYVVPGVGGEMDFTEPYKITVIDALGNRHNNTIRVVPTPPKTKFSKVWEKNCTDLGLASRNNTGLAIYGQYLAVQEYNGPIYLYDMKTGAAVKTIDAARSFMMKARTDDAGHLITSRENIYGAGFMVFYYSEADQEHKYLGPYIRSFREDRAIPLRAKIISVSLLWITAIHCVLFLFPYWWLKGIMAVVTIGVTIYILSFKTRSPR